MHRGRQNLSEADVHGVFGGLLWGLQTWFPGSSCRTEHVGNFYFWAKTAQGHSPVQSQAGGANAPSAPLQAASHPAIRNEVREGCVPSNPKALLGVPLVSPPCVASLTPAQCGGSAELSQPAAPPDTLGALLWLHSPGFLPWKGLQFKTTSTRWRKASCVWRWDCCLPTVPALRQSMPASPRM